jgi:hypothetical protein
MATNNDGKKSSNKKYKGTLTSTLGDKMWNALEPERAPSVIRIEANGTVTEMVKSRTKEGVIYYTGIPVTTKGHRCNFGLALTVDGYFDGSGALNFIANGGWPRGSKPRSRHEKAEARNSFITSFLIAAIQLRTETENDEKDFETLKKYISDSTNFKVEPGNMTEDDRRTLALLDVPYYLMECAEQRGLRMVPNIPEFIASIVNETYATCVAGSWDHDSTKVALTSGLSASITQLMRENGFKFVKVRNYAVKAASGKPKPSGSE